MMDKIYIYKTNRQKIAILDKKIIFFKYLVQSVWTKDTGGIELMICGLQAQYFNQWSIQSV